MKALWPWLALFALLSAGVVLLFAPLTGDQPYPYDSADYMWAGVQGFTANYFDRNSVPFWEFLRKGIELRNDPGKRTEMSLYGRRIGDMNLYRHFHGPIYAYWIALWTHLGVRDEAMYRNVGLLAHTATALLLMLAYWTLFPTLPRFGGLLTAVAFLLNRTALITAVEITQHIAFLFTAVLTLWMFGLFLQRFEARWWYATMASLALAVASVETSALVGATIAIVLVLVYRPLRERWPSKREQAGLLLKGAGVLLLVLFAVWPAGVYKLSVARGFMFLAYMALERKTFALYGPLDVWRMKFTAYPWEYGFMFAGFVAAAVLWRRLDHRREALPWLIYGVVFTLATMKITLEYTHYRGTIAAVWVMTAGIAAGHLWRRSGAAARVALLAVTAVCLTMETVEYRAEAAVRYAERTATEHVLNFVRSRPWPPEKLLYVPYYFIPALHFYHPEIQAIGYDVDWTAPRLLNAILAENAYGEIVCAEDVCSTVESAIGRPLPRTPLAPSHDGKPLFALRTKDGGPVQGNP